MVISSLSMKRPGLKFARKAKTGRYTKLAASRGSKEKELIEAALAARSWVGSLGHQAQQPSLGLPSRFYARLENQALEKSTSIGSKFDRLTERIAAT